MHLPREKVSAAISALHAAEQALLLTDTANGENGVLAGRCAVAAVYLETAMKLDTDDAYEALKLVARHVPMPSGLRAVVDAALIKAGLPASEPVRRVHLVRDHI